MLTTAVTARPRLGSLDNLQAITLRMRIANGSSQNLQLRAGECSDATQEPLELSRLHSCSRRRMDRLAYHVNL